MQPQGITALRDCYGKALTEPGVPAVTGFQMQVTSVSRGLPAGLPDACAASDLSGSVHELRGKIAAENGRAYCGCCFC